ncbi:hypothetical protein D4764_05G0009840 [Takifugu flavidus]|uniref:Uncharacterized protein n=1 Tax=Takifugu flavidus TaxID=433684 RepID=A0A5C6N016_9TELE|nr:hypothetical protein D4764_05G0009840 [Takifugu flavidus]
MSKYPKKDLKKKEAEKMEVSEAEIKGEDYRYLFSTEELTESEKRQLNKRTVRELAKDSTKAAAKEDEERKNRCHMPEEKIRKVLEHLFYFIRHPGAMITDKSFNKVVQCGSVRGEPVKRFLQDLTWLHAPAVALSTFWDKSKKDQHHQHMHDFLTFLSDEAYEEDGRTVMNIPVECLQLSPEEASKDKQLVERLEGEALIQSSGVHREVQSEVNSRVCSCAFFPPSSRAVWRP